MSSLPTHFLKSISAFSRIVDSMMPLKGVASKGISPFINTSDSPKTKLPLTLKPEILNLNVPVLPDQDSSK